MCTIIQEIDNKVVIAVYKVETTKNKYGIGIQAKEALLNYAEVIPKHLVYLYNYFPSVRDQIWKDYIQNLKSSIIKILIKSY